MFLLMQMLNRVTRQAAYEPLPKRPPSREDIVPITEPNKPGP